MDTEYTTLLECLFDDVSTVSVKRLENGIYRAWGVGIGVNTGKVIYSDGGGVLAALSGIKNAIVKKQWRVDRFTRAF